VSIGGYGWFFGAFGALVISAAFIGLAGVTFFSSLTPLYVSIAFSVGAIVSAVIAWRRHPHPEPPK
jgi:membrane protein implicated in regulation of membrane protease activity